jgi:Zn-dependent protease with chaperone function
MKGGAFLAFAAATLWAAAASPSPIRDEAFERQIVGELRARDPTTADVFVDATAESDRGNLDRATELFEEVRRAAPWFVHATRRLCGLEARRGHRDRAIALCREAVAADDSSVNEAALAASLIQSDGPVSEDDALEALRLAREASAKEPEGSPFTLTILCQSAIAARDFATLSACADRLRKVAPDEVSTHYFGAVAALTQGHTSEAERELDAAHAKGLPDEVYANLSRVVEESRSPLERWGGFALDGMIGWLAGFALLLGVGALLSAQTLRSVERVPAEASGRARGPDAILRRAYRIVLWVTCAYYYASLPVVASFVVVLGVGVVWACVAGALPFRLGILAAILVLGSLWAIAKSLVARGRHEAPGEKLELERYPRLHAVLDEVADRIGTRAVDAVYMTPSADVAVLERGGLLKQVSGKSERCLVLGAAVLDGLQVGEFKAILAHEYGHFHNEDTAGGGFALAVRRSVLTMAVHLQVIRTPLMTVFNPTWWFVRGFYLVFLRVSQGASRLQEVLADRWAAFAYGSEASARGLRHVVERNVRFDAHLNATLNQVIPQNLPLANLYAFTPDEPISAESLDRSVAEAMTRPATAYDSHPSPADRIVWLTKLAAPGPPGSADDAIDAWLLVGERAALEERMTEAVRAQLAQRGISVTRPA